MIVSVKTENNNEETIKHYYGISDFQVNNGKTTIWFHSNVWTEPFERIINGTVTSAIEEGVMDTRDLIENIHGMAMDDVTIGVSIIYPQTKSALEQVLNNLSKVNSDGDFEEKITIVGGSAVDKSDEETEEVDYHIKRCGTTETLDDIMNKQ